MKAFHLQLMKLSSWPLKVTTQYNTLYQYWMFHLFIITGLFPDAAVILKVDDQDVVNRILPNKMVIWRRKRDKRLAIREAKKQKKIKEWVSCCTGYTIVVTSLIALLEYFTVMCNKLPMKLVDTTTNFTNTGSCH